MVARIEREQLQLKHHLTQWHYIKLGPDLSATEEYFFLVIKHGDTFEDLVFTQIPDPIFDVKWRFKFGLFWRKLTHDIDLKWDLNEFEMLGDIDLAFDCFDWRVTNN